MRYVPEFVLKEFGEEIANPYLDIRNFIGW